MSERPSDELVDRMVALVRDLHADHLEHDLHDRVQDFCARTAAIVAELPKPVDPDLIEAREICARQSEIDGHQCQAAEHRRGRWDYGTSIAIALAAIKRGRELAALSPNEVKS